MFWIVLYWFNFIWKQWVLIMVLNVLNWAEITTMFRFEYYASIYIHAFVIYFVAHFFQLQKSHFLWQSNNIIVVDIKSSLQRNIGKIACMWYIMICQYYKLTTDNLHMEGCNKNGMNNFKQIWTIKVVFTCNALILSK